MWDKVTSDRICLHRLADGEGKFSDNGNDFFCQCLVWLIGNWVKGLRVDVVLTMFCVAMAKGFYP